MANLESFVNQLKLGLRHIVDPDAKREFVTQDGGSHDCGPYCEHPGQNGVHERRTAYCFTCHDVVDLIGGTCRLQVEDYAALDELYAMARRTLVAEAALDEVTKRLAGVYTADSEGV